MWLSVSLILFAFLYIVRVYIYVCVCVCINAARVERTIPRLNLSAGTKHFSLVLLGVRVHMRDS